LEVLDRRQQALLMRRRALLDSMVECLTSFGALSGDVELVVRRALADLEEHFLLISIG